MKYCKCLSYPLPFYATQNVTIYIGNDATQKDTRFLNSRISANHDKVEELSANHEILINGIVPLLQKSLLSLD
jgi:hypothetical protein